MQFPERELEIIQLARTMATGLARHHEVFQHPLVTPEQIHELLAAYEKARRVRREGRARLRAGAAAKKDALKALTRLLRAGVRYVESIAGKDPARLHMVGWGPRRKRTRTVLQVPGQPGLLTAREEGPDWVVLDWQPPQTGGPATAWVVERRHLRHGEWTHAAGTVATTIRLDRQETGVELEYRVYGINQAGNGPPGNSVRVVL